MRLEDALGLRFGGKDALEARLGGQVVWSGSAWTPAELFTAGQQGLWYEPLPEYLFQDAAGTIAVTADGDPVGLMLDRSPNGRNAIQPTSAKRPAYRTDGIRHWLEFAISSMNLQVDLLNGASGLSAVAAARFDQLGSSTSCLFRYSVAGSTASTRFQLEGGRSTDRYNVAARRRDSDPFDPLHTETTYAAGADITLSGLVDFSEASAFIRVNGEPDGQSLDYLSPGAVDDTDSAGAILGRNASDSGQEFIGRLYGLVILPSFIGAENASNTETYFAEKAGGTA